MFSKIKMSLRLVLVICSLLACNEKKIVTKTDFVIANGQMPNIIKDKDNDLQLVYGMGDSIMYTFSSDNGNSFSSPMLIAALPHLYSFAMRGPQIAATGDDIMVTACNSQGNIYSYFKKNGNWKKGARVNDVDTVAKEGLMALCADGENAFAVWLDLRGNKRNKIYGAQSQDGGKTWSENLLIYASPDTSVCECCKPSVAMKGKNVYVMFRNRLNGDRDLYLIKSSDGGASFGKAQKLGKGSWKLNACPMDGGSLAINKNGKVQTVWRRNENVFTAVPGIPEIKIGSGKNCTIETVDNKNVYAWTDKGDVIFIKADGEKKVLGKGSQPVLKALDNEHVICVWENEKQIHASILKI